MTNRREGWLCLLWLALLQTMVPGCGDPKPESIAATPEPLPRVRLAALPTDVLHPEDNQPSAARVELGRLLFYDPILSGDRDVACATCHHPSSGYGEPRKISIGVNGVGFGSQRAFLLPNDIPFTRRNAQSLLNCAFNGIDIYGKYDPVNAPMFWDLRSHSLETQALEPIKAMEEMRGMNYSESEILAEVERRLQGIPAYRMLFEEAFPGNEPVRIEHVGKALAAFERTLVANNSRFDRYMRGDAEALSLAEQEGLQAFKDAGCAHCHNGPMFSDWKTHVLGAPASTLLGQIDSGFQQQFAFRTPTLRNLRFTFPYMHNGELNTLDRVLEFYEDISQRKSHHDRVTPEDFDPLVKHLDLDVRNMDLIVNFLLALNDEDFDQTIPVEVPSGLPVGGNIH